MVCRTLLVILCSTSVTIAGKGQSYWNNRAQEELSNVLKNHLNNNVAKNVILFVGSGMGLPVVTAGRIYKGQKRGKSGEDEQLSFEKFPYVGLSKTYSSDKQVPDTASAGTAMFTGVKVNHETLGLDDSVKINDCNSSLKESAHVFSILAWAQEAGKSTGIVTTSRVTDAIPAATYSHSANSQWECDSLMPANASKCLDIARQLVEGHVGKEFKVIFGGGRQCFLDKMEPSNYDPNVCRRKDNRNLLVEWERDKKRRNSRYQYIQTRKDLVGLTTESLDYVLGLFDTSHLPYEYEHRNGLQESPHLIEMVDKAIDILHKNSKGYILMVQGGRIDHALDENYARRALEELMAFDSAIDMVMGRVNLDDTLIIVTADHSSGLAMVGYPHVGNNILGMAGISGQDKLPYTTLMFATGQGFHYVTNGTHVSRANLTKVDTKSYDYRQLAAVPMDLGAHTGEDVPIYAIGPRSHLFMGVHEENYIAHAIQFATCIGSGDCNSASKPKTHSFYAITILIIMLPQCYDLW